MGRIPGIALTPAAAVVMPHHRSAVAKARPSLARRIAFREQCAIGVTAGEDVVSGRCHLGACLGERCIPGEIDTLAVKFVNAGSDLNASCVDPRTPTNSLARVNRWRIR